MGNIRSKVVTLSSSFNDVELIAAPNAGKHRCFITGVGGDWTTTDASGAVQPYAEIYQSSGAIRFRVFSPRGVDQNSAEASCIQIQP
jgi:hypothetical protein